MSRRPRPNSKQRVWRRRRPRNILQDQLRWLLQYAGAGIAEAVAGGPQRSGASDMKNPCAPGCQVFRRASDSSQDSQVPTLHHAASAKLSVVTRSPIQMPRARSLDSGARRRFYPMAGSRQLSSQHSLPGCSNQEKCAPKRRSFPSPRTAPRVVDVPVRMSTSQQLVQVAKQRPLWLQKAADAAPRSSCRTGKGTSPHLCPRGLKPDRQA